MKCWRCGKKLNKGQVHILHLICGLAVPVCADDRQCYSFIQRIKRRRKKSKYPTVKNNRGRRKNKFISM